MIYFFNDKYDINHHIATKGEKEDCCHPHCPQLYYDSITIPDSFCKLFRKLIKTTIQPLPDKRLYRYIRLIECVEFCKKLETLS